MEQDQANTPPNILNAADARHYAAIHGAASLGVRDAKDGIWVRIMLLGPEPLDPHWVKRLKITFIDPAIGYEAETTAEEVEPFQPGYGTIIETAWVYTVAGLNHFDAQSSMIMLRSPSGRLIAGTPLFPHVSSP